MSFKGISADNDARYTSAERKLLLSTKFPAEFSQKVDIQKVNVEVIRPWISDEVQRMLGFEDEVVIELVSSMLQDSRWPDPKRCQLNLMGFLEKKTPAFMLKLWTLLLSAQTSIGGIPAQFVEAKKKELQIKREQDEMIVSQLRNSKPRAIERAPAMADNIQQSFDDFERPMRMRQYEPRHTGPVGRFSDRGKLKDVRHERDTSRQQITTSSDQNQLHEKTSPQYSRTPQDRTMQETLHEPTSIATDRQGGQRRFNDTCQRPRNHVKQYQAGNSGRHRRSRSRSSSSSRVPASASYSRLPSSRDDSRLLGTDDRKPGHRREERARHRTRSRSVTRSIVERRHRSRSASSHTSSDARASSHQQVRSHRRARSVSSDRSGDVSKRARPRSRHRHRSRSVSRERRRSGHQRSSGSGHHTRDRRARSHSHERRNRRDRPTHRSRRRRSRSRSADRSSRRHRARDRSPKPGSPNSDINAEVDVRHRPEDDVDHEVHASVHQDQPKEASTTNRDTRQRETELRANLLRKKLLTSQQEKDYGHESMEHS